VAWRDGYRFAIIKASGGHSYRNPYLGAQVARARAAGLRIGYYHYLFEPSSGGDVMREAANFLGAILPYVRPGDTFWNDVEEFPKAVGFSGDLGGAIDFWCDEVQRAHGGEPGIYCATWYLTATGLASDARLAKRPFWIASWQDTIPRGGFLAPWRVVTIWQYNAFDAVGGRKPIDEDFFLGDEAAWDAIAKPGAPAEAADPWAYLKVPFGPAGHTVHQWFHGDYSLHKYGYPLGPAAAYGIKQPDGSLVSSGMIFQLFENGVWSSNGRGEPKQEAAGQVIAHMTGKQFAEWPGWVPLVAAG
jgi:GH25 family lysozyme M1 (1,4-beta-N-acetylmuramidase)